MVMFKAHTKAAGMIVAAALLAALCTAFSHPAAYASEVESPFTKTQDFAREIKEYVGDVAAQAEAEALEGRRQSVVAEADAQLGVPYSYGGTTPSGFDCSGFTRWVFSHALGRELPRTAAEQSALGVGVSLDELVPGDLLFWIGLGRLSCGHLRRRRRVHPRLHGRRPRHARHLRLFRSRLRQARHRVKMTPLISENGHRAGVIQKLYLLPLRGCRANSAIKCQFRNGGGILLAK